MRKLTGLVLGLLGVLLLALVPQASAELDMIDTTPITVELVDGATVTFTLYTDSRGPEYDSTVTAGSASKIVTMPAERGEVKVTFLLKEDLGITATGEHTVTVTATNSTGALISENVKIIVTQYTGEAPLYYGEVIRDIDYEDTLAPEEVLELSIDLDNQVGINFNDVTITAWIEDSNGDRLGEKVETNEFNLRADQEKTKTLSIEIPEDADEDTYTINVIVEADEGFLDEREGSLDVERNEHSLKLTTADFDTSINAGESLDVKTVILNNGQEDEENVRVKVWIEDLDVSEISDYFEVQEDEEAIRYFTLPIPETATSGEYTLNIRITSDNVELTKEYTIKITGGAAVAPVEGIIVSADATTKRVGAAGAVYAITITNNGNTPETFSVEVAGTEDWAQSAVNPAIVVVQPGTSKTVSVFVSPYEGVTGTKQFTVYVKQDGTIIDTLGLTAQVGTGLSAITGAQPGVISEGFKWAIGVLIVVLVILFVAWEFKKGETRGKGKKVYY